jgi:hypothetical protein
MPDIIIHEPDEEDEEPVFDPYAAVCPFDDPDDIYPDEEEYDDA